MKAIYKGQSVEVIKKGAKNTRIKKGTESVLVPTSELAFDEQPPTVSQVKSVKDPQARINSLRKQIDGIMGRAHGASRRHEDCGPLDIAYEQCEPLEVEIKVLEAQIAGQAPSVEIQKSWEAVLEQKARDKAASAKAAQFTRGSIVRVNSPKGMFSKLHGKKFVILGTKGKGMLRVAETETSNSYYMVWPDALELVEKDAVKIKTPKDFMGKVITWNGRKGRMTSKVIGHRGARCKCENGWLVPCNLIEKAES